MRSLDALPERVTVYEVGPRDGLQHEPDIIAAEAKIRFINMLSAAHLPAIEVSSFVRPGAVPQLSDAELVAASIEHVPGIRYTALVPNSRGMERAAGVGLGGVALFTAASESFSRKNTNASIGETLDRFRPVAAQAHASGLWMRGYVSTAFGCPYEGDVAPEAVVDVTRALVQLGVDEVAISDTIGVATPRQVVEVVRAVTRVVELPKLALHFHDTRGTALANVLAGLVMGITTYDSSAGGLGGCPYAPGATGNLATEDLLYMLRGLGIATGVNLAKVVAASAYLATVVGRQPPSRYYRVAAG